MGDPVVSCQTLIDYPRWQMTRSLPWLLPTESRALALHPPNRRPLKRVSSPKTPETKKEHISYEKHRPAPLLPLQSSLTDHDTGLCLPKASLEKLSLKKQVTLLIFNQFRPTKQQFPRWNQPRAIHSLSVEWFLGISCHINSLWPMSLAIGSFSNMTFSHKFLQISNTPYLILVFLITKYLI